MSDPTGLIAGLRVAAPLVAIAGAAGLWLAGVLVVLRWAGMALP